MKYRVRNEEGDEREVSPENAERAAADGYMPVVSDGSQDRRAGSLKNLQRASQDGFTPDKYSERYYEGQATKMADKGGDQEGTEATTHDNFMAAVQGAKNIPSFGTADKLDRPGEWVNDIVQGNEFGTATEARHRREDEIASKSSTFDMPFGFKPNVADVVDTVGSVFMPGPGGARHLKKAFSTAGALNKAKAVGTAVKGSAALGAVEGAGRSRDLLSEQGLVDTAIGGTAGGGVPVGLHGVGRGIQKVGGIINKGANKAAEKSDSLLNLATGIDPRVTKGIMNNPDAFNNSKGLGQISDEFTTNMDKLQTKVRDLDDAATRHLSDTQEVSLDGVKEEMLGILKKEGVLTEIPGQGHRISGLADSQGSFQAVQKTLDELDQLIPTEVAVKRVVKQLDAMADWNAASPDTTKKVLRQVRRAIDQRLKNGNPEYKKAMVETAKKTDVLSRMNKAFGMKRGQPTDLTHTKLKTLKREAIKGGKPETQKLVQEFDDSMLQDLEYSRLGDIAEQSTTQGSRRTVAFGAAGSAVGGAIAGFPGAAIGGQLGAGLGYIVDRNGQKWSAELVAKVAKDKDKWNKFLKEVGYAASDKMADKLQEAALSGGLRRMLIVNYMTNKKESQK